MKIQVLDDDDDTYDLVDHYEYQYNQHSPMQELDSPTKSLSLIGTNTQ